MSSNNHFMRRKSHPTKALLSHSSSSIAMFPASPVFAKTLIAGCLLAAFAPIQAYAQSANPIPVVKNSDNLVLKVDPQLTIKPGTTVIQAEQVSGQPDRVIHLDHQVEVTRGNLNFTADKATYLQVEDQLDASGNVKLQRDGDCYSGDLMRFILETGAGYVHNPSYFFAKNNGQGRAEKIEFESEEKAKITNGTYSTCEGLSPDWYLQADTMSMDTGLDRGVANKTRLYFKGVPILGTPSWLNFSFPLSGARHSGLLPPTVGHSNKGGVEFGMPYYFNIAPNRDFTLHPKLIARRGLQLGMEGRYLGETYAGESALEIIRDKLTQTTRYSGSSTHRQALMPELVFSWNLNKASDNDYPADFSNSFNQFSSVARYYGTDYRAV
jgi:LPS-assembly protein